MKNLKRQLYHDTRPSVAFEELYHMDIKSQIAIDNSIGFIFHRVGAMREKLEIPLNALKNKMDSD